VIGTEVWHGVSDLVWKFLRFLRRQVELGIQQLLGLSNTGSDISDFWINTEVWNNIVNFVTKRALRKWVLREFTS
jgi:hypothetical protein|tara:strand:+ start:225 stop:449 length:225 start_codon:yes stop_codon:yes gene_type:complete